MTSLEKKKQKIRERRIKAQDSKMKDMFEPIKSFTSWEYKDKTSSGYEVVKLYEEGDTHSEDNRLHAIVKRVPGVLYDVDYLVAAGYSPDDGTWNQGFYDFKTFEDAENFLKENYRGRIIPFVYSTQGKDSKKYVFKFKDGIKIEVEDCGNKTKEELLKEAKQIHKEFNDSQIKDGDPEEGDPEDGDNSEYDFFVPYESAILESLKGMKVNKKNAQKCADKVNRENGMNLTVDGLFRFLIELTDGLWIEGDGWNLEFDIPKNAYKEYRKVMLDDSKPIKDEELEEVEAEIIAPQENAIVEVEQSQDELFEGTDTTNTLGVRFGEDDLIYIPTGRIVCRNFRQYMDSGEIQYQKASSIAANVCRESGKSMMSMPDVEWVSSVVQDLFGAFNIIMVFASSYEEEQVTRASLEAERRRNLEHREIGRLPHNR